MKKSITKILLVLIVIVGAVGIYFYKKVEKMSVNTNAVAQQEALDIVNKVGKLIVLPQDELPAVATVSDPSKLKSQPFFAKAKAGDKVLLYKNSGRAYLYDPVANKLIEVAPITLGITANPPAKSVKK